jgi:hypothetical protein
MKLKLFKQFMNEAVTMPASPVIPAVAASGTPARDEVVNNCAGNIYTAIYDPATFETILAGAKRLEVAGVTPTEEEWAAAQKKFFATLLTGLKQIG